MAESARAARRPRFTLTESAFKRKSSDFIKHGMIAAKLGRRNQGSESVLEKTKGGGRFGRSAHAGSISWH